MKSISLNKKFYNNQKNLKKLFKEGFCIIEKVLSKNECNHLISNLKRLSNKIKQNKNFIDEKSDKGQIIIRDLPLRNPKIFLNLIDKKKIMKILDQIFGETFILDNCQASGSINVKKI